MAGRTTGTTLVVFGHSPRKRILGLPDAAAPFRPTPSGGEHMKRLSPPFHGHLTASSPLFVDRVQKEPTGPLRGGRASPWAPEPPCSPGAAGFITAQAIALILITTGAFLIVKIVREQKEQAADAGAAHVGTRAVGRA